ncbi:MAG: 3-dehydroquinate synthase [Gemmatimonadota bacterium]|jgi:3-dehydroquinate synthase
MTRTERLAPSVIEVTTSSGSYDVVVGSGALEELPALIGERMSAQRFAIISDDNVAPLHGRTVMDACLSAGLDPTLFTFPAGESSKTRKSWSILTDEMLEAGFGRDSCVIAVGGGVTTDLAGFVAATFLRGVPVVQVPTSYLAMIDASVGGKTGVDVHAGKNLVGAFHPPDLVVADPEVLATLALEERAQGLVEAFKHGAILDAAYFDSLDDEVGDLMAAEASIAGSAVARSVELKADVVSQDEFEGGYRQILNFGHTLGHALEAASHYAIGHGTAVAIGMLMETRLGERLGITEAGTYGRLQEALEELLGPLHEVELDPEAAVGYLRTDKKVRGGRPRVVLLKRLGEVDPGDRWSHDVAAEILAEELNAGLGVAT